MAKLIGADFRTKNKWISLSPLPRSDGEDATEYHVELGFNDSDAGIVRTFTVAGWQSEHDEVWRFADGFSKCSQLLSLTDNGDFRLIQRYLSCYWLRGVLWGNPNLRRIMVQLFVEEEQDVDIFRSYFLYTDVIAAEQFGNQLKEEIALASPRWMSENC